MIPFQTVTTDSPRVTVTVPSQTMVQIEAAIIEIPKADPHTSAMAWLESLSLSGVATNLSSASEIDIPEAEWSNLLAAARSEKGATLLATPKVLTLNNTEASFETILSERDYKGILDTPPSLDSTKSETHKTFSFSTARYYKYEDAGSSNIARVADFLEASSKECEIHETTSFVFSVAPCITKKSSRFALKAKHAWKTKRSANQEKFPKVVSTQKGGESYKVTFGHGKFLVFSSSPPASLNTEFNLLIAIRLKPVESGVFAAIEEEP